MKCSIRSSVRNNTWPSCSVTNCLAAYWQKAVRSHVDVVHFLCADNVDDEDDIGTIKELEKIDDDCDRNGDGSAHVADLVQDASHNVEHDPLQMKIFFTFSDKNFLPKVTDLNL